MGQNKVLRRKIAGGERVIREHEAKIQAELIKPHPGEEYIRGWRREIDAQKGAVARLRRRLKREW